MPDLESISLNVDGVQTRIIHGGSGSRPIIFLHGAIPGVTPYVGGAHLWAGTLERFAALGPVAAIDMLGSGLTDYPTEAPLKLTDMIAHVAATIDKLSLTDAHIVGHDLGGLIALRLGMSEGRRVSSITVVASSYSTPIGDAWEDLTLAAPPAPILSRESQRWVMDRLSASSAHINQEILDAAAQMAAGRNTRQAVTSMASAEARAAFTAGHVRVRGEMWARARSQGYPLPVQIIWGAQDPLSTVEHAHILLSAIGKKQTVTQLHLVNEAGHFVFREQPARFRRIVGAFLEGIGA